MDLPPRAEGRMDAVGDPASLTINLSEIEMPGLVPGIFVSKAARQVVTAKKNSLSPIEAGKTFLLCPLARSEELTSVISAAVDRSSDR